MTSGVAAIAGIVLAASGAHAEPSRYGVMADIGLPDGLIASFAFRAHDWFTAHVGAGHNTNGPGLRLGGSFSPIDYALSPYAALEAGYYFEAETADWMRDTARHAGLDDETLQRVGYKFANGHLGLRMGNASAAVYVQGGVSYIDAKALVIDPKPNFVPPLELYRETEVRMWIVSGRVGVVYFF